MEKSTIEEQEADKELDDLLDDALSCFDEAPSSKVDLSVECSTKPNDSLQPNSDSTSADSSKPKEFTDKDIPASVDVELNNMFKENNLQEFMSSMMSAENLPDSGMFKEFERAFEMATAAADQPSGSSSTSPNAKPFEETLQQTIGGLEQNLNDLQNSMPDMMKMFEDMNLGNDANLPAGLGADIENMPDLMSCMQNMMHGLMSKDILYPSVKEISEKYPEWLEQNKSKISSSDFENYSNQLRIMREICDEFEQESTSDSEERKKQRLDKRLHLMEQMQKYGQPPEELMDKYGPPGLPQWPGTNPDQCSIS